MKTAERTMLKQEPSSECTEEKVSENRGGKTLAEILGMDIPAKDKIWEVVQSLSDVENRKFALWCARKANKNNVKAVAKYIDAVEAFYVLGTLKEKEMDSSSEEYRAAYWAACNAPDWEAQYSAYVAAYFATDSPEYWAAYQASDCAGDWAAQIEHLKEVVRGG